MSREHACIYSLGESSGPSIGGHPSWILPRPFVQGPQDEPITAQLRNGILFAPVDDDDSDPHVSDMFLMSKPPPSVPLGTVCFQCRWVLYVFGAVEHYHFVTAAGLFFSTLDRRYPYPVGGQWAALTTNYCVVVVVVALATTQWRRAPSSPQFIINVF